MSPTVRKRTRRVSTASPSRGGVSGGHRHQQALALDHLALVREVDRRHGEALARDVLPDVELGPVGDREHAHVLARVRRGRCTGSRARGAGCAGPTGRTRRGCEKMRSLARAFSSSRRAPPMRRRSRTRAMASSSVTDWCGVAALGRGRAAARGPLRIESSTERTIRRSPSSAARASRKAITSGSCGRCRCAAAGTGSGPGRNAFSASRSITIESLPPENSSAGLRALGHHLAQDVDRFGLEPVEVRMTRRARATVVRAASFRYLRSRDLLARA